MKQNYGVRYRLKKDVTLTDEMTTDNQHPTFLNVFDLLWLDRLSASPYNLREVVSQNFKKLYKLNQSIKFKNIEISFLKYSIFSKKNIKISG